MRRRNVLHFLVLSLTMAVLMALCPSTAAAQQKATDADRLGMALEYFQSAKYHEALLIFQKLDKQYKLNPRFKAYMALCYYYEWDYKKAVGYFDKVLPLLGGSRLKSSASTITLPAKAIFSSTSTIRPWLISPATSNSAMTVRKATFTTASAFATCFARNGRKPTTAIPSPRIITSATATPPPSRPASRR